MCDKSIKMLYESREKVIKLFNDYSKISSRLNIDWFMKKH